MEILLEYENQKEMSYLLWDKGPKSIFLFALLYAMITGGILYGIRKQRRALASRPEASSH